MAYDPLAGFNNTGGYSQYKGLNKYNPYIGPKYKQDDVDVVKLEWVDGMTPENLWDLERSQPQIPAEILKKENCADIGLKEFMISDAQRQSTQRGFKQAGTNEYNLLGYRDFPICPDKGLVDFEKEEEHQEEGKIDYRVVNEQSAKYRYGFQHNPANLGQNLPGSMQVLQQGNQGGEIIWKEKARGNARGSSVSGYYAGWNAIKWADNNMTSNGINQ